MCKANTPFALHIMVQICFLHCSCIKRLSAMLQTNRKHLLWCHEANEFWSYACFILAHLQQQETSCCPCLEQHHWALVNSTHLILPSQTRIVAVFPQQSLLQSWALPLRPQWWNHLCAPLAVGKIHPTGHMTTLPANSAPFSGHISKWPLTTSRPHKYSQMRPIYL